MNEYFVTIIIPRQMLYVYLKLNDMVNTVLACKTMCEHYIPHIAQWFNLLITYMLSNIASIITLAAVYAIIRRIYNAACNLWRKVRRRINYTINKNWYRLQYIFSQIWYQIAILPRLRRWRRLNTREYKKRLIRAIIIPFVQYARRLFYADCIWLLITFRNTIPKYVPNMIHRFLFAEFTDHLWFYWARQPKYLKWRWKLKKSLLRLPKDWQRVLRYFKRLLTHGPLGWLLMWITYPAPSVTGFIHLIHTMPLIMKTTLPLRPPKKCRKRRTLRWTRMRGSSFILFSIAVLILVLFLYWVTISYAHAFSRRGRNIMYRDFYECGFRMVPDVRAMLDIQFSVIGIIFLIYDMEIILLTPALLNIVQLPAYNIGAILMVLFILILSYWFEWEKHTLTWSLS